jgi:hypothetical protein
MKVKFSLVYFKVLSIGLLWPSMKRIHQELTMLWSRYKLHGPKCYATCQTHMRWVLLFQRIRLKCIIEWLRSFPSNHLPLTTLCTNPITDFRFFHVRKLSSRLRTFDESTRVSIRTRNFAGNDNFGLPPPIKQWSRHITYSGFVRCRTPKSSTPLQNACRRYCDIHVS